MNLKFMPLWSGHTLVYQQDAFRARGYECEEWIQLAFYVEMKTVIYSLLL